jgi:calcium-activated chloride channel regulator 4
MNILNVKVIFSLIESVTHSFTIQYAGCGKLGLPIVLSQDLILGTGDRYGDSAKVLVHNWAQYRYGVFNEFEFPNDSLYPAFYCIPGMHKSDIRVTACTDGHDLVHEITKDINGYNCELETHRETGLPIDGKCVPLPDMKNNSMQSSFMYSQTLKSVSKFCEFEVSNKKILFHNIDSPNKQNVLCDGNDT